MKLLAFCALRSTIQSPRQESKVLMEHGMNNTETQLDEGLSWFKFQMGELCVEYRGEQSFIVDDLARVVQELLDAAPAEILADVSADEDTTIESPQPQIQHMSTNTIAGNMGAKSGPDLVMAAIAHVQLVQRRDKATRSDIMSEMKKATTYYKSTFGSNLSSYLKTLVRARRLNLVAENTYALVASERSSMQAIMSPN